MMAWQAKENPALFVIPVESDIVQESTFPEDEKHGKYESRGVGNKTNKKLERQPTLANPPPSNAVEAQTGESS